MALHLYRKTQDTEIAVWHIQEDKHYFLTKLNLDEIEQKEIENLNHRKLLEWVSSRYLIRLLKANVKSVIVRKDEYGKPYIKDQDEYISISHTGKYVAILISKYRCGIDIQEYVRKIYRIQNRFLSSQELESIPDDGGHTLHLLWGAKESIYKAYGKKKVDFRKHMFIDLKSNVKELSGHIKMDDYEAMYKIFHIIHKEYMLVYATEIN